VWSAVAKSLRGSRILGGGPALAELVNLEDLWRAAGTERDVRHHRHDAQLLAVCLELLRRIPKLADTQVPFGTEADVVFKAVGKWLNPSL
jgi:hypothetical protein